MDASFEWDVVRVGENVRVDLLRGRDISNFDTDEIVAAAQEVLTDPEVSSIRLDGPALALDEPPAGLKNVIQCLHALAKSHGKRLVVGHI